MKQNTKATLRFYFKQIGRYKLLAASMLFLLTVGLTTEMLWALILKDFFNHLVQVGAKDLIVPALYTSLLLLALDETVNLVSMRGFNYLLVFFESKIMGDILNYCFEYLHQHSYNFFNKNFTGSLVKRINRMAGSFEALTDKFVSDFYPIVFKLTIVTGVLFYLNIWLGTILLVWSVIFITINCFISVYTIKFGLERAEADSKVTAVLADTITNSVNIKLFSALKFELKNFAKTTQDWLKKTQRIWIIHSHSDFFQGVLMVILEISILYIAIKLWQQNILTVGDFFLIQAYLLDIFRTLWRLGKNIQRATRDFADADEMSEILIAKHEVSDKKNARALKITSGKIEFEKVDFSYGDGEESVIKGLSFKVTPGEKIALIGPSGGGKSTIIKLLLRLFDIQKGKILIDHQDISKVTQDSLRRQIALVPQDPILFHRTLMENIRYGRPEAKDQEVVFAAKMAYCHDFIMGFNKGYDTLVGERGVRLSGGQRQRVAIARAILSNAKILLLDEATSSLDSESENLIQDALKNLIKNKTTFIIAHRLSTIMEVDRIFVLKDGQIIEEGQHADLVNRRGSLYGKLWNIQVGGFIGEN